MQADISQKQAYLFENVIQKGYDPNLFQEYLLTKKQNADDLSAWQFSQLKKIVADFQALQDTLKSPEKSPQNSQQFIPRFTQVDFKTKHQTFVNIIKCTILKPSKIANIEHVEIFMKKFEKKEGGIFQKSYICYFFETPCLNAEVERRYSDFEWLRSTLQILHPGLPIPPLPKKGMTRKFDDKHLRKRMMILQMYLNKMAMIPDIKNDIVFESFLLLKGPEFEKFKQQYKKMEPLTIQKISKPNGDLKLSLQPNTVAAMSRMQKYMQVTQPQVKRIYKGFKAVAMNLEGAAACLTGVSTICKQINNREAMLAKETEFCHFPNNLFSLLEFTSAKYGQVLMDQARTFRKQMYQCVKYESLSMLNYIDMLDRLAALQQEYLNTKVNLQKKMQKMYEQPTTKWGLPEKFSSKPSRDEAFNVMLPKQRSDLNRLREKYALFNTQIYDELKRYYGNNLIHISKSLKAFARLHSTISSQQIMLWTTFLVKSQQLSQNKGQRLTEIMFKV